MVLGLAAGTATPSAETPDGGETAAAIQAARVGLLTAERVLYSTDQALSAAAVIVSTVKNGRLVTAELSRIAADIPGARAIIVLDERGRLLHDSYKFPAASLDLSDREYFQRAYSRPGKIVIGATVVGRTSSASFVPIANRIGRYTFVAVITPHVLVDVQEFCSDCWSIALNVDSELLAVFPQTPVLPELLAHIDHLPGNAIVKYANSVVAVAWVERQIPFTAVAVRGIRQNARGAVDLN
ncbi:MAG: histidine kinase [Alphaproteobacteria bacterium]|nr:histidine kinase [Alphaproteobacteria bacterium]